MNYKELYNYLKNKPFFIGFCFYILLCASSQAQGLVSYDTIPRVTEDVIFLSEKNDSITKKKKERTAKVRTPKSPLKAGLLSAFIPGAGQIYNGRWWKAPIVWGAEATCLYFLIQNQLDFVKYRDAYRLLINDHIVAPGFEVYGNNPTGLKNKRDGYKSTRDLMYLVTFGVHALSIVDAVVDAHLSTFNVSEKLAMRVSPASIYIPEINTAYAGLTLSFQLKSPAPKVKPFKF